MRAKKLCGMLVVATVLITADRASAQGWGNWSGGFGLGGVGDSSPFSWNSWAYTPDYVGAPPYFSVRPPVYYDGKITRRSYGDSPFPYSAERSERVAEREFDAGYKPAMIVNPYVREKNPDDQQSDGRKLDKQQMVYNPFR